MPQFKYQINESNGEKLVYNVTMIETPAQFLKKTSSWPNQEFIQNLDLNIFPLISDFFAEIMKDKNSDTYIKFNSLEHGDMGIIPIYYDHFPELPVYGTPEQSFSDLDYCLRFIIFRKDDLVYVLFGYAENNEEYDLYYKVPVEIYEAELKKIL